MLLKINNPSQLPYSLPSRVLVLNLCIHQVFSELWHSRRGLWVWRSRKRWLNFTDYPAPSWDPQGVPSSFLYSAGSESLELRK